MEFKLMPFTLPTISRRQFLTAAAAGAATCLTRGAGAEDRVRDPNRFALLSDTHIAGDPKTIARGISMHEHLQAVVREILASQPTPAEVFISGDCVYSKGLSEDYSTLLDVLKPLSEAGLPIHLGMGNHDHRERFREAFGEAVRKASSLEAKHVLVVPSPQANWFVLDSLDQTDKTPGTLGGEQLQWLAQALDQAADKPALVVVHHQPDNRPVVSGLVDTNPLFEVLSPRRHVKALFFGHTHVWLVTEREGIHLVNLPPTAYVFSPGQPNGWVDASLTAAGMTLELRCVNPLHARHGQRVELKWRS
jgi:3',5'-cyclic AMP phosphodiesterase CpdA